MTAQLWQQAGVGVHQGQQGRGHRAANFELATNREEHSSDVAMAYLRMLALPSR